MLAAAMFSSKYLKTKMRRETVDPSDEEDGRTHFNVFRTWNGNNIISLVEQPCKSDLTSCCVVSRSDGSETFCDFEDERETF